MWSPSCVPSPGAPRRTTADLRRLGRDPSGTLPRMSSNSLTLAPAPPSEAAEQVRAGVREFLAAELAAGSFETHVDTWPSGVDPAFSKKLGERGWLGVTWPEQDGGGGRP